MNLKEKSSGKLNLGRANYLLRFVSRSLVKSRLALARTYHSVGSFILLHFLFDVVFHDKADLLNYEAGRACPGRIKKECERENGTSKQGQRGKIHLFIGLYLAVQTKSLFIKVLAAEKLPGRSE